MDKINTMLLRVRFLGQFIGVVIAGVLLQSITAHGQPMEVDLGVSLQNPSFLREFNGSFEVGLKPGGPAMNERESVLVSIVSEMYQESTDAALSFILEEVRKEELRIERAQRYEFSNEYDYEYSANIEYVIGQLYQLNGNRTLAERYYLQAIEKYPSYVSAYIRMMEMYLFQQDCEKAIAAGKRAIEIGGVNGFVFNGFGRCYFMEGDYDAALSAFRMANSFLPDDEAIDYYQAVSALNMGYAREAINILDELIRQYPNNSNYYFLQVNAYLQKNDYDGALETTEIARRKGMHNIESYSLLGNIYIQKQMPEAAAEAFIRGLGLETQPTFQTVLQQFNYLFRTGYWQLAQNYLDKVREVYDGRLNGKDRISLDVMDARLQINSDRATDGADLLREVISGDPTNGDALISLARYHRQQQDFERASIYFQRAAKEDEVALEALMDNSQMAVDQEQWESAIDLLRKASEIAPPENLPTVLGNIRAIENVLELLD